MSAPRLSRALGASALVHAAVLAALLALAGPRPGHPPPMLHVSLVGVPAVPGGAPGADAAEPSVQATAGPSSVRPSTPAARRSDTRRANPDSGGEDGRSAFTAAVVTPVQSDIWVLGAAPGTEPASGRSANARAAPESGGGGDPGRGPGPGGQATGTGTLGSSAASLLEALQQRLAWSAARCAPASAVGTARHGVPGVPLHFCLDAAGRPSGVGLLGTTGSEQLDRAARDCVVPGALPLPPAQGCYTVEVRFPIRG